MLFQLSMLFIHELRCDYLINVAFATYTRINVVFKYGGNYLIYNYLVI